MKETKTYCDVCGREVKAGSEEFGTLTFTGRKKKSETEVVRLNYADICMDCSASMFTVITRLAAKKGRETI